MAEVGGVVRCAIYTRKSTEEGLEQDFNSLQAQREAAEAYIRSQCQRGWSALAETYDDGGCTGANLERPALQRLLAAIETGKVECVVVYKVDRLSRSLLDFARLMSVFEQRSVSFVSVTQEFSTTTSLGRLTLNILLSFAQFEREIIGERTRDKLGAARRKGKWTGGIPMLGYDVEPGGGRLVVNDAEAAQAREIFAIADAAGNLQATWREVEARGLQTKQWRSRKGRTHGGKPFCKNTLRLLLGNILYAGSIRHKGIIYPGEQAAIVELEVWERVNRQLEIHSQSQTGRAHQRRQTLLTGLLYCGRCGAPLVVAATCQRGRSYSYYRCGRKGSSCGQAPVASVDLESAVQRRLASTLYSATPAQIREMLERVSYDSGTRQLTVALRDGSHWEFRLAEANRPGAPSGPAAEAGRVPRVSRLLALATKLEGQVCAGQLRDYAEAARLGQVSRARLSQILGLRNLAPAIQEKLLFLPKIVAGGDPVTEKRMRAIAQVIDWDEQEKLFAKLLVAEPCAGCAVAAQST